MWNNIPCSLQPSALFCLVEPLVSWVGPLHIGQCPFHSSVRFIAGTPPLPHWVGWVWTSKLPEAGNHLALSQNGPKWYHCHPPAPSMCYCSAQNSAALHFVSLQNKLNGNKPHFVSTRGSPRQFLTSGSPIDPNCLGFPRLTCQGKEPPECQKDEELDDA